jgi:hypothetical protein
LLLTPKTTYSTTSWVTLPSNNSYSSNWTCSPNGLIYTLMSIAKWKMVVFQKCQFFSNYLGQFINFLKYFVIQSLSLLLVQPNQSYSNKYRHVLHIHRNLNKYFIILIIFSVVQNINKHKLKVLLCILFNSVLILNLICKKIVIYKTIMEEIKVGSCDSFILFYLYKCIFILISWKIIGDCFANISVFKKSILKMKLI